MTDPVEIKDSVKEASVATKEAPIETKEQPKEEKKEEKEKDGKEGQPKEEAIDKQDVVEESKKEPKESKAEVKSVPSQLFVREEDTFDIEVEYYFDGKKVMVKGIDLLFEEAKEGVQKLGCKIKYPSQGDSSLISAQASQMRSSTKSSDELDLRDFIQLEFIRLMVLIRGWDLDEELNNANIMKLHPKIVKSIVEKIREEIDMDSII